MITYVVELELAAALRDEYLAWLRGHVAEMLALPGFCEARIMRRREPPAPAGRVAFAVHYRLRDQAAWRGYLDDHAAHMRAAGVARFGTQVTASRHLLDDLP